MKRLGIYGLMLVLGCLQAASMAWPLAGENYGQPLGWLELTSLAGFAFFLDRASSAKQAFVIGWVFASAWLIAATWWLYIALHVYGGLNAVLAVLAVVLLGCGLALFYGAAAWAFHRLSQSGARTFARGLVFAAVWFLAEWLRGTIGTGFPWAAAGYAHVNSVLRHWAPWVGVYGLSAMSAALCMWAVAKRQDRIFRSKTYKTVVAGGVFILALAAWWKAPSHSPAATTRPALTVALVQGNVSQDQKFSQGVQQALRDYRSALVANTADLIVTPETAIPYFSHQLPAGYWQEIRQRYVTGQQAALIGMPMLGADQSVYTNSALGLIPHEKDYRYDKQHLVPFGEFVPPLFHWFLDLMNIPLGDFTRGDAVQAPMYWQGERIAPNICFEDLFGEELAKGFANPDQAPTLLVNLSNIAWFGDSIAIEQHLNISRMRALELHRPMLRATNTGATAFIDAQGQVVARLPSGVQDTLTVQVRGVDEAATPYARWVSVCGLWPLVLLALGILAVVGWQGYLARHGRRRFAP
jgi:apolipoprotein N-acyltransferase